MASEIEGSPLQGPRVELVVAVEPDQVFAAHALKSNKARGRATSVLSLPDVREPVIVFRNDWLDRARGGIINDDALEVSHGLRHQAVKRPTELGLPVINRHNDGDDGLSHGPDRISASSAPLPCPPADLTGLQGN